MAATVDVRPVVVLILVTVASQVTVGPVQADHAAWETRQSGNYRMTTPNGNPNQPSVDFTASQKMYFRTGSGYLKIDWDDLYINVWNGNTIYCAPLNYVRADPSFPYQGYVNDDNNPSSFSYSSTPAWAEVYVGNLGNSYVSPTQPIQHRHRAYSGSFNNECTAPFYFGNYTDPV